MYSYQTKNKYLVKNLFAGRCNCYLVEKNNKTILVDTSLKIHQNLLRKKIKKYQATRSGIDYLLLTHTHYDHAANAAMVKNEFKSKLIVHSEEAGYVENGRSNLPDGTNLFTRFIVWLGRNVLSESAFDFAPAIVDIRIDDMYDFPEEDWNIRIMHSPGHSGGSVSMIVDDEVAIAGDNIFGIFSHSIFPPFADDIETMMDSWRKLLDTNCKIFLPGHGKPITKYRFEMNYDKYFKKYGV